MVPILIVDEFPDALDQYSRSGGFSIDRMSVTHPAAPHFLSILPIDVDVASEEISHTDKLNSKTSDNINLQMHVPRLPSITGKFTQNSANDPLSSLSAISYSDTKYPNWSFTSSENPGERILATIAKRRARTLCMGTFLSVTHRTNVNYSNKLTDNCNKTQQIPDFRPVNV